MKYVILTLMFTIPCAIPAAAQADLSPLFKTTTGEHDLAELEEAAKDGKSFYKKMLPSVLSMFMPDTDYFAVKMLDRSAVPTVSAYAEGQVSQLPLEQVKDMWVVSLDDIKGAEAIKIRTREDIAGWVGYSPAQKAFANIEAENRLRDYASEEGRDERS